MPTRKQRRRAAKERRHEYETVWIDEEGNELEEPPEEAAPAARERRDNGKPKSQQQQQPRGGRAPRVPPEPSWPRALRRSAIWIVVLGVLLVWVQSRAKHPNYAAVIPVGVLYVLLFPVMTYYLDRSIYRRYLKNRQRNAKKR
ncbi:MAG TPA: hypothetical protein VLW05_07965 [Gaiellaceae bacterium]|nr:hypothetical protein [Gaiellaceae bacterium]